ncbi:hypothetical protein Micbo1qcDRAFT_161616 [Microdochium bolleyi]|uniref:Secreted protein n=1 Tax=Microdochium bolleyi TaxID=196109 RepID=A0A136J397_9PEZI|nr:hypothetical protein Micbo1qcDRAFT_161616 [Microdochium bolleyi]
MEKSANRTEFLLATLFCVVSLAKPSRQGAVHLSSHRVIGVKSHLFSGPRRTVDGSLIRSVRTDDCAELSPVNANRVFGGARLLMTVFDHCKALAAKIRIA